MPAVFFLDMSECEKFTHYGFNNKTSLLSVVGILQIPIGAENVRLSHLTYIFVLGTKIRSGLTAPDLVRST